MLVAFFERRLFAVWSVLTALDEAEDGLREGPPHALHFAGFCARIEPSMEEKSGWRKFSQGPLVQIRIWPLAGVGKAKPSGAIPADHGLPIFFSVIFHQSRFRFLPKILGVRSE